ncbi:DUF7684 family protein [Methyloversatilis universalis]|uniref:DUF7684 family protein n=1 Tax=Methyloversatilis universalis TaxID=378211 RepID=UPI000477619E
MHHPGKVVLVSTTGYSPERGDPVLAELVASKVSLVCAVGRDAPAWEEALDWLCTDELRRSNHLIVTTSHPGETLEEVLAFAEAFHTEQTHEVEVLYV